MGKAATMKEAWTEGGSALVATGLADTVERLLDDRPLVCKSRSASSRSRGFDEVRSDDFFFARCSETRQNSMIPSRAPPCPACGS